MFFKNGIGGPEIAVSYKQVSFKQRRNAMTPRQAIRVLMLSPIYFRLDVAARRKLVYEFCALYEGLAR
jgi:hypothetical protein